MADDRQPVFDLQAPGVDVDRLMAGIEADVAARRAAGAYADPRIARAERHNLVNLQKDEDFFDFYMACLRESFTVDINDFPIVERRARCGRLLVKLKTAVWKLLKFYTYRLWSQQNQVNGLLLSAMESAEQKQRERVAELEARVAELEARLPRS